MDNTKGSRTRRIVDTINLFSSLLLLLLFVINFYAHATPKKWEVGFEISGSSFVIAVILIMTIIICACISWVQKIKRKPRS